MFPSRLLFENLFEGANFGRRGTVLEILGLLKDIVGFKSSAPLGLTGMTIINAFFRLSDKTYGIPPSLFDLTVGLFF